MSAVAAKQRLGQRETQEDAYKIVLQSEEDPQGDVLMLLADGMGGHVGGEIASRTALDAFAHHFVSGSQTPRPRMRLREALETANEAIARRIDEEPSLAGMGCTLIGALKIGGRLVWTSVGDSVLFLHRAGTLRRLNVDHSVYGELLEMVAAGQMSRSEADAHPRRNALRSAVIGEPIPMVDLNATELQPGDLVVSATDGVETLSDDEIAGILNDRAADPPEALAETLLAAVEARRRPRQDNSTIVVYRHGAPAATVTASDGKWTLPQPEPPAQATDAGGGRRSPVVAIGGGAAAAAVLIAATIWLLSPGPPEPVVTQETATPPAGAETETAGQPIDDADGDAVRGGDPGEDAGEIDAQDSAVDPDAIDEAVNEAMTNPTVGLDEGPKVPPAPRALTGPY